MGANLRSFGFVYFSNKQCLRPFRYCAPVTIKTCNWPLFTNFYFVTNLIPGGELFSGTVADFSATDALIIKDQLRTEQYDYKHLNSK